MAKRKTAHTKLHTFGCFDSTSNIGLLCRFKFACDAHEIYKVAAKRLFLIFMKKSNSPTQNSWLTQCQQARMRVSSWSKTITFTLYPQVVSYLLQPYAVDENIVDAEGKSSTFSQPSSKTPARYAKKLIESALRCELVYSEQDPNEEFTKGLSKSIKHSMRGYCSFKKLVSPKIFAHHQTSILNLHGED